MRHLTRRDFLAASIVTAGGLVIAGCSSGDDQGAPTTGGDGAIDAVRFFQDGTTVMGVPQRLVVGFRNTSDGSFVSQGPTTITTTFETVDQKPLDLPAVTSTRRDSGTPRPFWVIAATFPQQGTFMAKIDAGTGTPVRMPFTVVSKDDAPVPGATSPMPAFDTPTQADPRGVDPVCTKDPACPLHAVDLRAALEAKQPFLFFVGTPAYCQTGVCGPMLDEVVDAAAASKLTAIHNEVYVSEFKDANTPTTDAMSQLGLTFEPSLFLVKADGTIAERLDVVFDRAELDEAISRLTA